MTATIQAIYRYPVKGLTPEPLAAPTWPRARRCRATGIYAIENGPSGFDPAQPAISPKHRFLS